MFRFANPQYLWLLLAIPALVLIFWAAAARRRKRLARFGNPGVLEELMPEVDLKSCGDLFAEPENS